MSYYLEARAVVKGMKDRVEANKQKRERRAEQVGAEVSRVITGALMVPHHTQSIATTCRPDNQLAMQTCSNDSSPTTISTHHSPSTGDDVDRIEQLSYDVREHH
jgi:hypothetical protein